MMIRVDCVFEDGEVNCRPVDPEWYEEVCKMLGVEEDPEFEDEEEEEEEE